MRSPAGFRTEPGRKHILRILKATERSFFHVYIDALDSSNSVSYHIGRKAVVGGQ